MPTTKNDTIQLMRKQAASKTAAELFEIVGDFTYDREILQTCLLHLLELPLTESEQKNRETITRRLYGYLSRFIPSSIFPSWLIEPHSLHAFYKANIEKPEENRLYYLAHAYIKGIGVDKTVKNAEKGLDYYLNALNQYKKINPQIENDISEIPSIFFEKNLCLLDRLFVRNEQFKGMRKPLSFYKKIAERGEAELASTYVKLFNALQAYKDSTLCISDTKNIILDKKCFDESIEDIKTAFEKGIVLAGLVLANLYTFEFIIVKQSEQQFLLDYDVIQKADLFLSAFQYALVCTKERTTLSGIYSFSHKQLTRLLNDPTIQNKLNGSQVKKEAAEMDQTESEGINLMISDRPEITVLQSGEKIVESSEIQEENENDRFWQGILETSKKIKTETFFHSIPSPSMLSLLNIPDEKLSPLQLVEKTKQERKAFEASEVYKAYCESLATPLADISLVEKRRIVCEKPEEANTLSVARFTEASISPSLLGKGETTASKEIQEKENVVATSERLPINNAHFFQLPELPGFDPTRDENVSDAVIFPEVPTHNPYERSKENRIAVRLNY